MTGDTKAKRDREFSEEALRWLPEVTRYALSLAREEADADDLVQETYLQAYRAWDSYTPGTECRAWLFTICRNTFFRSRKRNEREVTSDDPELEALAASAVYDSAQQGGYGNLFTQFDLADAITEAIDRLPDAFREVVVLIDALDQSYETAAETLGIPIGTVRSRLFRGRRLLQQALISHARDAGLAPAQPVDASPESSS